MKVTTTKKNSKRWSIYRQLKKYNKQVLKKWVDVCVKPVMFIYVYSMRPKWLLNSLCIGDRLFRLYTHCILRPTAQPTSDLIRPQKFYFTTVTECVSISALTPIFLSQSLHHPLNILLLAYRMGDRPTQWRTVSSHLCRLAAHPMMSRFVNRPWQYTVHPMKTRSHDLKVAQTAASRRTLVQRLNIPRMWVDLQSILWLNHLHSSHCPIRVVYTRATYGSFYRNK